MGRFQIQGEQGPHTSGTLLETEPKIQKADVNELRDACAITLDVEAFYKQYMDKGINYGPAFRVVKHIGLEHIIS